MNMEDIVVGQDYVIKHHNNYFVGEVRSRNQHSTVDVMIKHKGTNSLKVLFAYNIICKVIEYYNDPTNVGLNVFVKNNYPEYAY